MKQTTEKEGDGVRVTFHPTTMAEAQVVGFMDAAIRFIADDQEWGRQIASYAEAMGVEI